ncbi:MULTISPECIES: helix-turn-helix domain-containing protein [Rhodobacterales]|uniref:Transcriptional regulator n=1 Tax=Pelagivirga sediminicola TaxID=2170575 RepID=A0A2T7G2T5_9RHOB|nr:MULTISPECIES: helix-turn-helix transcriptional regulator [Rhodobacterales]MCQ0090212.1 helix-turn-helix transcriptional regulator [Roseovarius sp. M141]PVA08708.1 transcriptional regulator [Pelagivirga sediminicola]
MDLRDRVGQNIQDLRRSLGISQEDLALRARVNRGYMGKVENGKYSVSLDILEKIALVLGVDPHVLLAPRDPQNAVSQGQEGYSGLGQQSKT